MTLLHGDCLKELVSIPDGSVDLICCDLPYGSTKCKWDSVIDLGELWKQFKRIRKDTTPIFMFGTLRFGLDLIEANKPEFRYEMVWEKSHSSNYMLAKKRPQCSHEYIFVFYKKQPYYDLSSHIPAQKNPEYIQARDYNGVFGAEPHPVKKQTYEPRLPRQILEFKKVRNKINPTAKPIDLLKWILKYFSKENDMVLDPTMGSGTMIVACNQMNRKAIGIEKDKEMYDKAVVFINTY